MNVPIEVVEPAMAALLRQKSEGERLRIAWGMWKMAREMLHNLLRSEHRDWSEKEIEQETARRLGGTR